MSEREKSDEQRADWRERVCVKNKELIEIAILHGFKEVLDNVGKSMMSSVNTWR